MGQEWTPEQYDALYKDSLEYKKHYMESIYWPIWKEVLDRIPKNAVVFELGCGTGQFARALECRGILQYWGVDSSRTAVELSIESNTHFTYIDDILTTDLLQSKDYDYLVCLEVLEHIKQDLFVLNRIRPGKHCLISVPDYDGPNHVRFFPSRRSVVSRYGNYFDHWEITEHVLFPGQTIWLLDGVRNEYC